MNEQIEMRTIYVKGMTCSQCPRRIKRALEESAGVVEAQAVYPQGKVRVRYDKQLLDLETIFHKIRQLGYEPMHEAPRSMKWLKIPLLGLVIVALYWLIEHAMVLPLFAPYQLSGMQASYGVLFLIGLLTSMHCLAMCGGISLSQGMASDGTEKKSLWQHPALLYNLGRVLSYTVIGFIVGGLGSMISLSYTMQGLLKIAAGVLMIFMGLRVLGIWPSFLHLGWGLPQLLPKQTHRRAFVVGLANGMMPCGPLQAMQLYALSTGSATIGALSMFFFSLGTTPLMLGIGALSTSLWRRHAQKFAAVGAILVMALGLSMFSQGWYLSGWTSPLPTVSAFNAGAGGSDRAVVQDGVQMVRSTLEPGAYPNIVVKAGMPVKWQMQAAKNDINGCNNRLIIDAYGIEQSLKPGDNMISFTPTQTGTYHYTCWMGMIKGTITVVEP